MNLKYTCRYCGETNEITSIWKWFWTPHMGAKKWLKCKACGALHLMLPQNGRKWLDWYK